MELTLQYESAQERELIISQHSDKYLISEKNIQEGNFLIFSSEKPLSVQVEELKAENLATMGAVAEVYEMLLGGM